MKKYAIYLHAIAVAMLMTVSNASHAQIAGTQTLGVSVEEDGIVLNGWSAKKSLIGKSIYNDQGQKVGVLHDIIIAPDNSASFAIVAAHQILGVAQHDVAVPMTQIDASGGKLVWAGATREAVKNVPVFRYAKVRAEPISRQDYHH